MKQIRANEQIKQQLPHTPEKKEGEGDETEKIVLFLKICCNICEEKRSYGEMALKWKIT